MSKSDLYCNPLKVVVYSGKATTNKKKTIHSNPQNPAPTYNNL
jgi:hypothetical protein